MRLIGISIHAPVKGATATRLRLASSWAMISIHAPVKGATSRDVIRANGSRPVVLYLHGPARPVAGCHPRKWQPGISIHAPVKGATRRAPEWRFLPAKISIHAPVKGATLRSGSVGASGSYFNPRTREGCDIKRVKKGAVP